MFLFTILVATAEVGAPAPLFSLKDTQGATVSLAELKGKTVVLEWFNPRCPFVMRHTKDKTMASTAKKHKDVVWLAINSTAKDHQDYMQPRELAQWARDNGIDYPLLTDADGVVGKSYGAKTTPHMFVIDKDGKLAYAGAIDDDPTGRNPPGTRKNFVDQALTSGKPEATKSYGCSIKYRS